MFESIVDAMSYEKGCQDTIEEFVKRVELKYLGVHPDELHNPHYAYEIVNEIRMIAEQMKVEV